MVDTINIEGSNLKETLCREIDAMPEIFNKTRAKELIVFFETIANLPDEEFVTNVWNFVNEGRKINLFGCLTEESVREIIAAIDRKRYFITDQLRPILPPDESQGRSHTTFDDAAWAKMDEWNKFSGAIAQKIREPLSLEEI